MVGLVALGADVRALVSLEGRGGDEGASYGAVLDLGGLNVHDAAGQVVDQGLAVPLPHDRHAGRHVAARDVPGLAVAHQRVARVLHFNRDTGTDNNQTRSNFMLLLGGYMGRGTIVRGIALLCTASGGACKLAINHARSTCIRRSDGVVVVVFYTFKSVGVCVL